METSNCRLKLNKFGSDVPLYGVTPPEVAILRHMHSTNAGGDPIANLEITGETDLEWHRMLTGDTEDITEEGETSVPVWQEDGWSDHDEYMRLRYKYKDRHVFKVYPENANPVLPQTFQSVSAGRRPTRQPTRQPARRAPVRFRAKAKAAEQQEALVPA